jgi:hypothetical protein
MLVFSAYGQNDNIWEIFYVFLPFLIFYLLVPFFVKLEPCSDRSAVRKLHKKIDPLPVPDKRSSKKQEQPVQPIELNVSDDFGQSFLLAKKSNSKPVEDEEDKYDCRLFLRALQLQFWEMCTCAFKGTHDSSKCNYLCSCNIARCIGRYMQDLRIKGINKTMLMDALYLEMRKIWKSQM